jgi:hypothetical protein
MLDSSQKFNDNQNLIERTIKDESYLIDSINNELVLYKKTNVNKSRGYIKPLKLDTDLNINDLKKFITIDFETIKVIKNNHFINIPVLLGVYNFYNNKHDRVLLTNYRNDKGFDRNLLIQHRLEQLLNPVYNGFRIYAHNLSLFDGIL